MADKPGGAGSTLRAAADASGRWFFQNGPQRVYVDLAATPYIARTDPATGFVLHDGQPLSVPEQVFLTDEGQLVFQENGHTAMLDDRDIAPCLPQLQWHGQAVEDAQLLAWLAAPDAEMRFLHAGKAMPVQAIRRVDLAVRLNFTARPR